MEECDCPECGVIKCPEGLWGGECDCAYGLCRDCKAELHDLHCSKECNNPQCDVWMDVEHL